MPLEGLRKEVKIKFPTASYGVGLDWELPSCHKRTFRQKQSMLLSKEKSYKIQQNVTSPHGHVPQPNDDTNIKKD